jgi:hypothetical protein
VKNPPLPVPTMFAIFATFAKFAKFAKFAPEPSPAALSAPQHVPFEAPSTSKAPLPMRRGLG